MSCRYCKWCNTNETWGYKLYCEWYKAYYDPDDGKYCSHYE